MRAVLRLVFAFAISVTILPLSWSWTIHVALLWGSLHPWSSLAMVGSAAAVIALSFHLGEVPLLWRYRWGLATVLVGTWSTVGGVSYWNELGGFLPRDHILLLAIPATFYVLWLTWMFFYPWRWKTRLAVLTVLLGCVAPYWILLKLEGYTGGYKLNYVWRQEGATRHEASRFEHVENAIARIEPNLGRGDYPQFLGPTRNGVLSAIRLERDWNQHPPHERWRRPVGAGWSSFAIVGDHALTQEQRGDDECVVCYRIETGEQVWLHAYPNRFESPMGGLGPRATPTVFGGNIYAVTASGRLMCLDGSTGGALWSADILQGEENTLHGVAGSPLVVEEQNVVVVSPTGPGGPSLAAYDLTSGHRRWAAGSNRASYCSPTQTTLAGTPQILIHDEQGVTGHGLDDGRILWHFPWTNSVVTNVAIPIAHAGGEDQVFLATGYGVGGALIRVAHDATAGWTVQQLWTSSAMKAKFCTVVLWEDHLYGLDDGILACIEIATGKRKWKEGRYGHGQLLLAGDLLLIQAELGDVVLVEPRPEGLCELGRILALHSKTWNNPALAGPWLLVRNSEEAVCFELPLRGR